MLMGVVIDAAQYVRFRVTCAQLLTHVPVSTVQPAVR